MSAFYGLSAERQRVPVGQVSPDDLHADRGMFENFGEAIAANTYLAGVQAAQVAAVVGAAPLVIADQERENTAMSDWYFRNIVEPLSREAMNTRERSQMYGMASQMVGELIRIGGTLIAAGPVGVGVSETVSRSLQNVEEGKTGGEALLLGAAHGAPLAAAVALPIVAPLSQTLMKLKIPIGPLTQRLGYGVSSNIAAGIAIRGSEKEALLALGYREEALGREDVMDPRALFVDAVLGAGFGWLGHALVQKKAASVRAFMRDLPSQEQLDAATTTSMRLLDEDMAPKRPTRPAEMDAHIRNLDEATDAMTSGRTMQGGKWVKPLDEAADVSAATRKAADEAESARIEEQLEREAIQLEGRMADPDFRIIGEDGTPVAFGNAMKALRAEWQAVKQQGPELRDKLVTCILGRLAGGL
jgi:hypothetical protein